MISAAAGHSASTEMIRRAQRAKVFNLKMRFDMGLECSNECNSKGSNHPLSFNAPFGSCGRSELRETQEVDHTRASSAAHNLASQVDMKAKAVQAIADALDLLVDRAAWNLQDLRYLGH